MLRLRFSYDSQIKKIHVYLDTGHYLNTNNPKLTSHSKYLQITEERIRSGHETTKLENRSNQSEGTLDQIVAGEPTGPVFPPLSDQD